MIDRMKQITDKYKRVNQPSSQQTTMEFIPSKKSLSQYGILCCGTEPHKHLVISPTKSKKGNKCSVCMSIIMYICVYDYVCTYVVHLHKMCSYACICEYI